MKAADRCTSNRQGDRCQLAREHSAAWHRGNFTEWKLGPDGKPGVFRALLAIPPARLEAMFRARLQFLKASAK